MIATLPSIEEQLRRNAEFADRAATESAEMSRAQILGVYNEWFEAHADRQIAEYVAKQNGSPVPADADEVPAGTDVSSGITPAGLTWFDVFNLQKLHDGDTPAGDVLVPDPWEDDYKVKQFSTKGMRVLGCDACEVTFANRTPPVTADEIVKGKECRDRLQALVGAGKVQVAPPLTAPHRDNFGRPLVWARIVNADGTIENWAEFIHANGYQRGTA